MSFSTIVLISGVISLAIVFVINILKTKEALAAYISIKIIDSIKKLTIAHKEKSYTVYKQKFDGDLELCVYTSRRVYTVYIYKNGRRIAYWELTLSPNKKYDGSMHIFVCDDEDEFTRANLKPLIDGLDSLT